MYGGVFTLMSTDAYLFPPSPPPQHNSEGGGVSRTHKRTVRAAWCRDSEGVERREVVIYAVDGRY